MTCQICTAKTELNLCGTCQARLRTDLRHMPELIGWLADAAHGQTRLGASARRSTDKGSPMLCNLPASELLDTVTNMVDTWTRDLCEIQGIDMPELPPVRNHATRIDPALLAPSVQAGRLCAWLAQHTHDIALHPAADEFADELSQRISEIERMINRPTPPIDLGPCPILLTNNYGQHTCNTPLTADRDDIETQCHHCKTTHNVKQLITTAVDNVRDWLYTQREILDIMGMIGEPIPGRTWRRWRKDGRIQSRNQTGAEPKYLLHEVRTLRAQMTRQPPNDDDKNTHVM